MRNLYCVSGFQFQYLSLCRVSKVVPTASDGVGLIGGVGRLCELALETICVGNGIFGKRCCFVSVRVRAVQVHESGRKKNGLYVPNVLKWSPPFSVEGNTNECVYVVRFRMVYLLDRTYNGLVPVGSEPLRQQQKTGQSS
jgi:hypothetical protein